MRPQFRRVVACRDAAVAAQLASAGETRSPLQPADAQVIRELLIAFWLAQLRHHTVLQRNLGLVAWVDEQRMQHDVLRLRYVLVTGNDCGPLQQLSSHALVPVMHAVRVGRGDRALASIGAPLRTHHELLEASAQLRDEVARVGRQLADQVGFGYPTEIDATVQRRWEEMPMINKPSKA